MEKGLERTPNSLDEQGRPLAPLRHRRRLVAGARGGGVMSSSSDIDSVDPKVVTRYEVGQRLGKGACTSQH